MSPERREKLSQEMTQRWRSGTVAERPNAGRPPGSLSSPVSIADRRRKRVASMVAEAAQDAENAQRLINVFKDGIAPNQPMYLRLKAAEAWLKIEGDEAKLELQERETDSQKRDRAELLEILSEKLTSGHAALLVRKQLNPPEEVIDAVVVDER